MRAHTSRAGRRPVPESPGRIRAGPARSPPEVAEPARPPAVAGPAVAPRSPASASRANIAPPPAGKRAAVREVAPGHMRATNRPVPAQAQFKGLYDYYKTKEGFEYVIGITAKDGKNVDTLLDKVALYCNDENIHFPENMYTDQQERFLASEIIREKLFMYLDKEVPLGVAVGMS